MQPLSSIFNTVTSRISAIVNFPIDFYGTLIIIIKITIGCEFRMICIRVSATKRYAQIGRTALSMTSYER